MKKWLTQNLGLKFLSVICASILWLIVMNINDPIDEQRFIGIPVELTNTDAITDEGKVYQILDNTNMVNVTVRAKRSVLDQLDRDNIQAVADLSEVSVTNMVTIKLSSNRYSNQIDSISSNTEFLKLNIEDVRQKQLQIQISTIGTPEEGYLTGSVTAGQTVVRLRGPESVIEQVESVQAVVDVTNMTSDVSTTASLVLYDAAGNRVEDSSIQLNITSVEVKVSILATKSVPFTYRTSGVPADGYEPTGRIIGTYDRIRIAGAQNVLDTISSIEIPAEELNVTGQTDSLNVLISVEDYLPAGVVIADEEHTGLLGVMVEIEPLETTYIPIPEGRVRILNVPEGYEYTLVNYSGASIGVRAIPTVMADVDEGSFVGEIDLTAYFEQQGVYEPADGVYSMEAIFTMPERVTQVQRLYVSIELTKIVEEEEE
ncbi:MAG: CdaR family protein [Clostridium sp.]|nr:CdaR family protein [Clostridium sp.]